MTGMAEMRKCQQAYLQAKEEQQRLDREMLAVEEQYIQENGIVNEDDGTIPHGILNIHGDEAFMAADEACWQIAEKSGLADRLRQAADAMTAAEDALVKSTIELLPGRFQKEKETLAAGARNHCRTWNMAIKLKIMEIEKHPLDDLKNDEITKKRVK